MAKTITGNVSNTVTLTAASDPLFITSTGSVQTGGSVAVFGDASQAWDIENAGFIAITGSIAQFAIELQSGSTVNNSGRIQAETSGGEAVRINGGAGLVTNSGKIVGNYDGVVMTKGGAVTNTGQIYGTANVGVYIGAGAGTVTNSGNITGGKYAVQFKGNFNDRLIVAAGGTFHGKVAGGSGSNTLELAAGTQGAIGTLTGLGSNYTGFGTLTVDSAASWQLDSTSTVASGVALTDAGTLINAGLIESILTVASGGTFSNTGFVDNLTIAYGVSLLGSGVVNNGLGGATDADISGSQDGILANNGLATITNAGTIYGFSHYGVALSGGGTVGNTGAIGSEGKGVAISGGPGAITNSGSIVAFKNGVQMFGGGTVTNTGTIQGTSGIGVYIGGGAATVTNAGSIISNQGRYAVQFAGNFTDRVIIDPGAIFIGTVRGGSGTNTLELAADPHGATGHLAGFAAAFENFGTIAIDSDANWQMDSTDTIATGIMLTDAGTLSNFGVIDTTVSVASAGSFANTGTVNAGSGQIAVSLLAGGVVSNASFAGLAIEGSRYGIRAEGAAATITNGATIIGTSSLNGGGIGLYAGGTITNTGTIIGDGAAGIYIGGGAGTVTNAGSIGGVTDAVKFSGSFSDLVIMKPGAVFRGKVQGGTGTNTLELAAGTTTATGTLANFASSFAGFGYINVDHGASWQFAASDTISSATSVTDNGTLKNAGVIDGLVRVEDGGSLANSGTITGMPGTAGVYLLEEATLTNTGLIENGCYVESGIGTVTNSGSIEGIFGGVVMFHGGTVTNTGQIAANANSSAAVGVKIGGGPGVVTNTGGHISGFYDGIVLLDGGTVVNTASIFANLNIAIYIGGGAGTVMNAGNITAGYQGYAVQFGGSFGDRVILDPGAVFYGTVHGGSGTNTLELAAKAGSSSAIGTLGNFATGFTNFGTIDIDSGASWKFAAGNTIGSTAAVYDSGVLNNAGLIEAAAMSVNGGSFGNSGTVYTSLNFLSGGTLTNTGMIDAGCYVGSGIGKITNAGTIDGMTVGVGMVGGTVTNSGLIEAQADQSSGIGVNIQGAADLVNNNGGTIAGSADGVRLTSGGTVLNKGVISGTTFDGIAITGGAATVTNAGTISDGGNGNSALQFAGSFTDRVIFDAGASFVGAVQGGSGSNTLELAAGSTGVTGTLTAFASSFTNFGTIAIDANTSWAIAANSTIGSTVTVTDAGRLSNSGLIETSVTLSKSQVIVNSGTIDGGSAQPGVAMLAGGTLLNYGRIEGTNGVAIAGSAGLVRNSGIIDGASYGVAMAAGGTLQNTGTIASTSHGEAVQIAGGAGIVTNTSRIGGSFDGVVLTGGGSVQNSGTISGGGNFGVYIGGGAGTLTNSGTISGSAAAVEFAGTFNDEVTFDAGAVFKGAVQGGSGFNALELAGGKTGVIGTLSSFSSTFLGFDDIHVDFGASWKNASGSTIGSGIAIVASGSFANAGVIESGVTITSSSFSNSGTIDGAIFGAFALSGGTLTNTGCIQVTGTASNDPAIFINGGVGTIINAGTISSDTTGVVLAQGGVVSNTGSIGGASIGITVNFGGTITDAGTISGGTFAASFGGRSLDRMILDPGAVLQGSVQGGSGTNTLELAAGSPAAAGTLANFGSEFPDFGQIVVDNAANWLVPAANSFGGATTPPAVSVGQGATLTLSGGGNLQAAITGSGTLQLESSSFSFTAADTLDSAALNVVSGATLSGTGTIGSALSLAGSLAATSGTLMLNSALHGAGVVGAAQGATVEILGSSIFSGTLAGSGSFVLHSGLTLDAGAKLTASSILDTANLALGAGENLQNASGDSFTLSSVSGQILSVSGPGFTNAGSFSATGGGSEHISAAFTNTGAVSAASGTLEFLGNVSNHGTIDAASGLVSFQTSVGGTGALQIGATGTLSLALGAGAGQTVDFLAGTGLLDLAQPTNFSGTISGFAAGDRIDLLNTPETSYLYANNLLTVKNGSSTVATLHFTGSSNSFSLTGDTHGGTFILFQ